MHSHLEAATVRSGGAARALRFPPTPTSASIGLVMVALAAITVIAVLIDVRTRVSVAAVGWLYLLVILPVAVRWGRAAGLLTAAVAAFLLLIFLTEPRGLPYTRNGIDLMRLLLSSGCLAIAVLLIHPTSAAQTSRDRRLAELVSVAVQPIVETGLDGTIQDWSAGAERLFGYPWATVRGQSIATVFLPAERGALLEVLRDLPGSRAEMRHEAAALAADGRSLDLALAISLLRDVRGEPRGARVAIHDITALRRVEQALRTGEEMLAAAAARIPEGLVLLDEGGSVVLSNDRAAALLGRSTEKIVGSTFASCFASRYVLYPSYGWEALIHSGTSVFLAIEAGGIPRGLRGEIGALRVGTSAHAARFTVTLRDATGEIQEAYGALVWGGDGRLGEPRNPAAGLEPGPTPPLLDGSLPERQVAALQSSDEGFPEPRRSLTSRELEVLTLIATSRSNQEIAKELGISLNTVERHIANIYRKLQLRGRVPAAAYALRHGLVPPYAP